GCSSGERSAMPSTGWPMGQWPISCCSTPAASIGMYSTWPIQPSLPGWPVSCMNPWWARRRKSARMPDHRWCPSVRLDGFGVGRATDSNIATGSKTMTAASKGGIMRVALLGSLALVLLVGSMDQRARAADDDDDAAFDTKIMRNILRSLGLRRSDDTGIEYRERSPLVIPPSRNLPPPETATLPPP